MRNASKVRVGAVASVWTSIAAVAWVAVACSSNSSRPAELGACAPTADASCSSPATVGGMGSGPPTDAGSSSDGFSSEPGTGCGEIVVTGANAATCTSCVESSCCQVNEVCAGLSACVALVDCTVGCGTNGACAQDCFTTSISAGQQAYDDLSACLSGGGCNPACPNLPLQATPDF